MTKSNYRIAILLLSNVRGGAEVLAASLFNQLSVEGKHSCRLVLNQEIYDLLTDSGFVWNNTKDIIIVGKRMKRLGSTSLKLISKSQRLQYHLQLKLNDVRLQRQVESCLKAFKADIVHGIADGLRLLSLDQYSRYARVATFCSCAGVEEYEKEAVRHADAVDVYGDPSFEMLNNAMELNSAKTYIARKSFANYERNYVTDKYRSVCFLGRMEPVKHPEIFVKMLNYIPDEILQRTKFYMIGHGSMMADIQQLGARFIRMGCLKVEQYVMQPEDYLAKSSIYVQCTECESHGNFSLLEAMASGNAIVSTNIPFMNTVVTPDVGFCVPADPEAFAERVVHLLKNPQEARTLGQAARERALSEYRIDAYAEHIKKVYLSAYNNKFNNGLRRESSTACANSA